ncbi:MAG: hypothetical protein ACK417_05105 [Bacteroidia bacterium]
MKKVLMLMFAVVALAATSCKKDQTPEPNNPNPTNPGGDGIVGDLTQVNFAANTLYKVVGDLIVPEGATVTIPEGVTLEFQEGPNGEAWFLDVFGSLRVLGSASARVTFTASDALINSAKNQGIGQLWGGIVGTNTAGDLIIRYADILYAGGACREENAYALPATGGGGELSAGDAGYALYYIRQRDMRQDGIFVLQYSRIAFCPDDAIRINGGKTLMTHNVFEVAGGTGGDAVNIKSGTYGDFAYNLFYNCATNGLKSADTGPGVRGICETNFYNNTFVACGYRRAEPGRGAGLNYESAAFGKCYNNLNVNTRFGLRLVPGERAPDISKLEYGYNWYYGSVSTITDEFYPTTATSSVGMIGNDPSTPIPASDVAGAPLANNPLFVNFDPSTFVFSGNTSIQTDPLRNNIQPIPAGANFRLQANSPALTGGKTDFGPVVANYASLDGALSYTAPAPSAFFGAFGTN